MSELTAAQTDELHQALLALRQDLRQLLDDSAAGARPVGLDEPIGRLSRMDALQQQSMARANRRTAELRLSRVEAALRRHAAGEYGTCRDCEEPIGFARLRARPEALLCVGCQAAKETRG